MAVAISSLSQVCRAVGQLVGTGINQSAHSRINVVIGTPAVGSQVDGDTGHRLNLFFFRFEPSGFFPDNLPGDPWLVRAHCLMTPFCLDDDTIAAGENDLRVLGELMRFFHESPEFDVDVDGEPWRLQAVFLTLGLDQLNQLWSTQGDTVYRPSALFELSLAPVLPRTPTIPAPRVGGLGFEARGTMAARHAGPTAAMRTAVPMVGLMRPDTGPETWAPALCLVDDSACLLSVSFAVGSAELTAFAPEAWIAGAPGSSAQLRWETWEAAAGWQTQAPGGPLLIADAALDPDAVGSATTRATTLPFDDRPGQLALYAERLVTRAADGVQITVRSNPVLVTLHAP
ncbi:Pvc16 family protein [Ideonella sp.]|uniref:Pvc16 family protein n=1 Tax=Ideonella sp. TaxID=1929293 RepID=UPI0035B00C68